MDRKVLDYITSFCVIILTMFVLYSLATYREPTKEVVINNPSDVVKRLAKAEERIDKLYTLVIQQYKEK